MNAPSLSHHLARPIAWREPPRPSSPARRDGSGGLVTEGRQRLRDARDRLGGAAVARMVGVTRRAIDWMCTGHRLPSLAASVRIQNGLGIAPGDWFREPVSNVA